MSKKSYIIFAILIIIVNIAVFYYYHIAKKGAWEEEKKNIEIKLTALQETYNNLLRQLDQSDSQNKTLSDKIASLEKEKTALAQELEQLRSPEYLADIVTDRIRLKLELKDLQGKIEKKDTDLASLAKYKEMMEALLGKEKHLSQNLSRSIAEERKKSYLLNKEASQKSSLVEKMEAKIGTLEKSELLLKDKITGLEQIVRDKDKELRELEKKLTTVLGANKGLENKFAQINEEKEMLEEELAATKRLYEEARVNKDALEKKLDDIVRQNKTLSDQLLQTSQKAVSLEEKLENMEIALSEKELEGEKLGGMYEKLRQEKEALQEKSGEKEGPASFTLELTKTITLPEEKSTLPAIKGKILASSAQYNFVIIDIGEEDGVKIGDKFFIYRLDKKLAEIEVTRIRSSSSFAKIVTIPEGITLTTEDTVRGGD